MHNIPFAVSVMTCTLVESADQGINTNLCHEVKQPDEHADSNDASDHDGCVFRTCCGVGQTTFFSSLRSSRKYLQTLPQVLLNQFSFSHLPCRNPPYFVSV